MKNLLKVMTLIGFSLIIISCPALWTFAEDVLEPVIPENPGNVIPEDSYAIYFNAMEGVVSSESKTVLKGAEAGALPTPIRAGYLFEGWYTDNGDFNYIFTETTKVLSSITVYAKWGEVLENHFVVTFVTNGGLLAIGETTSVQVASGGTVTMPSNPSREGYTFEGWYADAAFSTPFDSDVLITEPIAVYAKWKAAASNEATVTFNPGSSGSVNPATMLVKKNTAIGSLPTPTRDGNKFEGWFFDDGITKLEPTTIITKDITVFAKWTRIYNAFVVSFDAKGGTVSPESIAVEKNTPITQFPSVVREGYIFEGWYANERFEGSEFALDTTISNNITVYAKWTPIPEGQYLVSFVSNGGSYVENKTVAEGGTISTSNPSREGYTFDGWYTDSGLTTVFDNSSAITENLTLYAKWEIKTYTITYNTNGGSSLPQKNVQYNSDFPTVDNPTRNLYIFDGWYTNSSLTTRLSPFDAVTKDAILNAKWISVIEYSYEAGSGYAVTGLHSAYKDALTNGTLTIPRMHEGEYGMRDVYKISSYAFKDKEHLVSVVIPETVTALESYSFRDCTSLKSITIPDSITSIAMYSSPFDGCDALEAVTIVASANPATIGAVYPINGEPFSDNKNVKTFSIQGNSTLYSANDSVLFSKDGTVLLVYPLGKGDTEVSIASSVSMVGDYAFNNNNTLTKVTFLGNGTNIGERAFEDCSNLETIVAANPLGTLQTYAFSGAGFTNLNINAEVVGDSAFRSNRSLTAVTIGNDVTTIDDSAFFGCGKLESVTIGESVSSISTSSSSAFGDCDTLTTFVVDPNNAKYKAIDGNLYTKENSLVWYAQGKTATTFTVPNGTTSIGSGSLRDNTALKHVVLPKSLTRISEYAFNDSRSLLSITIPATVTYIERYAFNGCTNLTLYMEAKAQPSSFSRDWNYSRRPVIWGVRLGGTVGNPETHAYVSYLQVEAPLPNLGEKTLNPPYRNGYTIRDLYFGADSGSHEPTWDESRPIDTVDFHEFFRDAEYNGYYLRPNWQQL